MKNFVKENISDHYGSIIITQYQQPYNVSTIYEYSSDNTTKVKFTSKKKDLTVYQNEAFGFFRYQTEMSTIFRNLTVLFIRIDVYYFPTTD